MIKLGYHNHGNRNLKKASHITCLILISVLVSNTLFLCFVTESDQEIIELTESADHENKEEKRDGKEKEEIKDYVSQTISPVSGKDLFLRTICCSLSSWSNPYIEYINPPPESYC